MLHGIVPPIVTPFRADERIDFNAWQRIIDSQIAAGVDGLFVCGSSGEFYALDFEERTVALRFCRQAAAGRVAVCGNVGSSTTRDTVRLAQVAQQEGLDVVAVVTPYYIHPSQDELYEHFCDVCRSVRIPVVGYNYPQHGGASLAAQTVGRIAAACPNFVGIKDAAGDLEQLVAYRKSPPDRELAVFVGPEALFVPAMEAGCAGAVSGGISVAPKLFVELYRAFLARDADTVARLRPLTQRLGEALGLHTFPGAIKEALNSVGMNVGPCRRPVGIMPAPARQRLLALLENLHQLGYLPALTRHQIA